MKFGVFIEPNEFDNTVVNLKFISPSYLDRPGFSEAVDRRFNIINFNHRFMGEINDTRGRVRMEHEMEDYMRNQCEDMTLENELDIIYNSVRIIRFDAKHNHTIMKTKFILHVDGEDFYLRKNILGYVIDIRHSSADSDYTTWSMLKVEEIVNTNIDFILNIIPELVIEKARRMIQK